MKLKKEQRFAWRNWKASIPPPLDEAKKLYDANTKAVQRQGKLSKATDE
uniref:Uncharacterized protein n=1 Tax=Arundo donax TaxID=35708 RepID=A0A0A9BTJ5_ARUDO